MHVKLLCNNFGILSFATKQGSRRQQLNVPLLTSPERHARMLACQEEPPPRRPGDCRHRRYDAAALETVRPPMVGVGW